MTDNIQEKISNEELCKIITSSNLLESYKCIVCFELAPMVNINFPCNSVNKQTGKPKCSSVCCLKCARDILNLSNIKTDSIKCPICRIDYTYEIDMRTKTFKKTNQELYTLNVLAMTIIDDVIKHLVDSVKEKYKIEIKPICCQRCNMYHKNISSLHHHMRGDTIMSDILPCPESPIICKFCKKIKPRKMFKINNKCINCEKYIE